MISFRLLWFLHPQTHGCVQTFVWGKNVLVKSETAIAVSKKMTEVTRQLSLYVCITHIFLLHFYCFFSMLRVSFRVIVGRVRCWVCCRYEEPTTDDWVAQWQAIIHMYSYTNQLSVWSEIQPEKSFLMLANWLGFCVLLGDALCCCCSARWRQL